MKSITWSSSHEFRRMQHKDTKSEDEISHQIIGWQQKFIERQVVLVCLKVFMNLHYVMNLYLEYYVYNDKSLSRLCIKEQRLENLCLSTLWLNIKYLIEVKATEKNHPIYENQVITYLRLTGIKFRLLVNFGVPYVKDGVSQIINGILQTSCL